MVDASLPSPSCGTGRLVLLRTAMNSGHGGNFEHRRTDESFVLAFLVAEVEVRTD